MPFHQTEPFYANQKNAAIGSVVIDFVPEGHNIVDRTQEIFIID
jgi:hypothetical protein